jgi:hypothetical protein
MRRPNTSDEVWTADDADRCIPPEVRELSEEERLIKAQLSNARTSRTARKSLQMLTGEYQPTGDVEAAILDAEQRLREVKEQSRRILLNECLVCPNRGRCCQDMTAPEFQLNR